MRRFQTLIGFVALAGALACGGSAPSSDQPVPAGLNAWLRVDNQTFADFNMSVTHNTSRQRLGRSTANTTSTFKIPESYVGNRARLRFIADPVGAAQESISRELDVIPGDTVIIIIPPS
jgi:hypothetical protein